MSESIHSHGKIEDYHRLGLSLSFLCDQSFFFFFLRDKPVMSSEHFDTKFRGKMISVVGTICGYRLTLCHFSVERFDRGYMSAS